MADRRTRRTLSYAWGAVFALASCGADDSAPEPLDTGAASATSTVTASPPTTAIVGTAATLTVPSAAGIADDPLADLTDEQVATFGGVECATEVQAFTTALDRYTGDFGSRPQTVDDLHEAGYLDMKLVLFEPDGFLIRPAPGSGCLDVFAVLVCNQAAADLTEGRLAYLEANPGAAEPTQADLVAAGFLPEPSSNIDLAGGAATVVPGGRCDPLGFSVDWARHCHSDARTLEVAQEAYRAMNGDDANPTEADLVPEFLRHVSGLVDLVDSSVVPKAGGPCDGVDLGI
jgi:hypothetical protein